MQKKLNLSGKEVVLTGAASGIGRATAIALAQKGAKLSLVDMNEAGLAETAKLCGDADVKLHIANLEKLDSLKFLVDEILAQRPNVAVLINNAGVAVGGTFEEITPENFDWLMNINFHAPVRLTRAFLPILRRQDCGQIVNISSIFGIIAPAGQTAYSSAKFAIRGFSESLRHELLDSEIGVTVVHPGGINTSIAKNSRRPNSNAIDYEERLKEFEAKLIKPPSEAAAEIVAAIENRSLRLLIGNDAKAAEFIQRLWPVTYWKKLQKYFNT